MRPVDHAAAVREMTWYYQCSSADLGISSSYGNVIAAAFGFGPNNSTNHYEDKFVAMASGHRSPITKLRRIEAALSRMDPSDRRVLTAIHDYHLYPQQLVAVFGIKTGAVLCNETILYPDELMVLCCKKLSKARLTDQERQNLTAVTREGNEIYNRVHDVYLKARNEQ